MAEETTQPTTMTGRIRKASVSLMNYNPQPGMWAATGTAIAYAPTIAELRAPVAGGENIEFNEHGHSARTVIADPSGEHVLSTVMSHMDAIPPAKITKGVATDSGPDVEKAQPRVVRRETLAQQAETDEKHTWGETFKHGFTAFWKFFTTPTGFLMTIYGLNIVAWGAMLFFLLLGAAPAMNHPSKNSNDSPRKKWLEVDSQILNALFCVTGFGLAPWRFRDLWWLAQARLKHNNHAMQKLEKQNRSWFRPPAWYEEGEAQTHPIKPITFTGEVAPPTRMWKLGFVVWMYVLNTLFQVVLAGFMWGYNRINRPSWSTGMFIGLGCGSALLAGLMMWWEGRKIKKIEGPVVRVVEVPSKTHRLMR